MTKEKPVLLKGLDGKKRCWWCGTDEQYVAYHDDEWGMPTTDDRRLFEKICLEGFQAGLSWLTILRKRDSFRAAFKNFDFELVAKFGKRDINRLLKDAGIVRHQGKIESTINNAKRAIEMRKEFGSLANFFWQFEPRKTPVIKSIADHLGFSEESTRMSKELKKLGWSFVGPTTCYAFMESMGMVNNHAQGCQFRAQCKSARSELGTMPKNSSK